METKVIKGTAEAITGRIMHEDRVEEFACMFNMYCDYNRHSFVSGLRFFLQDINKDSFFYPARVKMRGELAKMNFSRVGSERLDEYISLYYGETAYPEIDAEHFDVVIRDRKTNEALEII